jgi:succinate-semialdehyde dehydrogenase/glutarate-semialdehyde dehydrogenase
MTPDRNYPDVLLHIGGRWRRAQDDRTLEVENPADHSVIGTVAHAGLSDLEEAADHAHRGFEAWSAVSPFERSKVMRRAADNLRKSSERIASWMTLEQGKPLVEARAEVLAGADIVDWFAEEARRTYGRIVPARTPTVAQLVVKEPVGPVAAFTPWNFPINQAVRKISGALAAGCSIVLKGPEETPASPAELVRAFVDAGLPDGVLNLVYGTPAEISEFLIPHPAIRKVSFTGSTAVGKELAALAGKHMKRVTMELGGHAPVIVLEDADIERAVATMCAAKFRNAGQVCVAPTRFLVERAVYGQFLERFVLATEKIVPGNGLDDGTTMGPLANRRRVEAMEGFITDAIENGAQLHAGGNRIGNAGNYFEPTVMSHVPITARVMNDEPFGPIALVNPVADLAAALEEANRLDCGLAAYGFTRSASNSARLAAGLQCGMVSINHYGLALPEVPFGGINDSGNGTEGGADALDGYLNTKFVTQMHA